MPRVSIRLNDEREYAWLLVRSDTVVGELIKCWQVVPIRAGSRLSAAVGYPIRLLLVVLGALLFIGVTLVLVAGLFELPVLAFAYVHRFLPPLLWQVVLWALGAVLLVGLAVSLGAWLGTAARANAATPPISSDIARHVLPSAIDPAAGWNRWRSVHVGHESSRAILFAGNFIGLGIVVQCLAVLAGADAFAGPVAAAWRWPVLFAEQLFHTMLLGITAGLVPGVAELVPASTAGQVLLALVNVFHASGIVTMMMLVMASSFKPRELFRGTTRDLADHLENRDVSSGANLMIHRVGVVRPLDPSETLSLRKDEFMAAIQGDGGAAERPSG